VAGGHRIRDAKLGDQRHANANLVAGQDLLSLNRLADRADVDAVNLPVLPPPMAIAPRRKHLDKFATLIEEPAFVLANDDRAT
jgi:hypothetical protein